MPILPPHPTPPDVDAREVHDCRNSWHSVWWSSKLQERCRLLGGSHRVHDDDGCWRRLLRPVASRRPLPWLYLPRPRYIRRRRAGRALKHCRPRPSPPHPGGEERGRKHAYPIDGLFVLGGLNKFHGQHALRERARKLDQGILIIRFDMPFNIWFCDTLPMYPEGKLDSDNDGQ
ncbi:hypothetical protein ACJX0J_006531, partial [Zea mays]